MGISLFRLKLKNKMAVKMKKARIPEIKRLVMYRNIDAPSVACPEFTQSIQRHVMLVPDRAPSTQGAAFALIYDF